MYHFCYYWCYYLEFLLLFVLSFFNFFIFKYILDLHCLFSPCYSCIMIWRKNYRQSSCASYVTSLSGFKLPPLWIFSLLCAVSTFNECSLEGAARFQATSSSRCQVFPVQHLAYYNVNAYCPGFDWFSRNHSFSGPYEYLDLILSSGNLKIRI